MTVMLLYFTALVDGSGKVQFRTDFYERDAPIIAGLNEPFLISAPRPARQ
ncbi:MAG: hypothetical protein GY906_01275 [bacterium]|nr:hypothetical protein [bacterium]